MTKPSTKVYPFSVKSQRSLIKPEVLRYSLVYKEDGFLAQYLCNKCHAKGNFKSRCHKDGFKVKLQEKKDMVCSVKMTLVVKKFPNKATLQGGLKEAHFSGIKEPVSHLRFGEIWCAITTACIEGDLGG